METKTITRPSPTQSLNTFSYLGKEWKTIFTTKFLREDLLAGMTLSFVALPLALAISVASGVPAQIGMISAIAGGAVCALLGGTTLGVTGPAAAVCIMTSGIVMKFGLAGIAIVTICAGVLQLLTGFLRLGSIVRFIPMPVIEGFIAAIGAIIAVTQFPVAVGILIKKAPDDSLLHIISQIIPQLPNINVSAAALTAITMATIMILPKFIPIIKTASFPLAIAVCTLLNSALSLNVNVLGAIPTSISLPALNFSLSMLSELALPIILMYGILSLESLLSALATDKLMIERNKNIPNVPKELSAPHNSNQELIGQGLGNMLCGFLGGIPVTGVIVRSAANVRIGGITRRSSFFHSLSLATAIFGVSSILSYIPVCSLAGILLATAYNMIHPRNFKKVFNFNAVEIIPMVVTFVSILLTDLTVGFEIGFVTQILLWIVQGRPILRFTIEEVNESLIVRMKGAINFLSKNRVDKIVDDLSQRKNNKIVLDFNGIESIDMSGAEGLDTFFNAIEQLDPSYRIVGCSDKIKKIILKLVPTIESRIDVSIC